MFCDDNGKVIFTVPASGNVATLEEEVVEQPPILICHEGQDYKIPLFGKEFRGVYLPEPIPGIIYLTSNLIAEKAARADVMAPHEKIRDDDGNVIGRISLVTFKPRKSI